MHLIFSDETNANKLSRLHFDDRNSLDPSLAVYASFYRSSKTNTTDLLLPFYATQADGQQILCVATKCNQTQFDPVTGTHQLFCNIEDSCTIFIRPLLQGDQHQSISSVMSNPNQYQSYSSFLNDPLTNKLHFVTSYETFFAQIVGEYSLDEFHRGAIIRMTSNLDVFSQNYAYDKSGKVKTCHF